MAFKMKGFSPFDMFGLAATRLGMNAKPSNMGFSSILSNRLTQPRSGMGIPAAMGAGLSQLPMQKYEDKGKKGNKKGKKKNK
tara:strand:+ start:565 stop:810 length:246 start_codon:yes stop_codon:yes gene_type:complete